MTGRALATPSAQGRFFHGTSTALLAQAQAQGGLREPHVTDNLERAEYYAAEASEDDGTDPVVVELIDVDPALLRYDGAAMEELVLADEDTRDQAWNLAAAEHPSWLVRGMLHVPAEAWEVSWAGAGSARYEAIAAGFIVVR